MFSKLKECVADAWEYGDYRACRKVVQGKQDNPCKAKLQAYVSCMEAHEGVKPDKYELEWCLEERELYRVCRDDAAGGSTGLLGRG